MLSHLCLGEDLDQLGGFRQKRAHKHKKSTSKHHIGVDQVRILASRIVSLQYCSMWARVFEARVYKEEDQYHPTIFLILRVYFQAHKY